MIPRRLRAIEARQCPLPLASAEQEVPGNEAREGAKGRLGVGDGNAIDGHGTAFNELHGLGVGGRKPQLC